MKKFWLALLSVLLILKISSIESSAMYEFDAQYYAKRYPDVVAVYGNDSAALEKHYIEFGIKEGRFINQQQEIDSLLPGYMAPSVVGYVTLHEAQKLAAISTPLPGYSTYVDINIEAQTMTYFENGEVKLQSPCVTGLANGKRNTPTGTYSIKCKVPGKRLKGPTWDCWVNRWMRFTNDSIGLHDASWRSEFGGEIYKTNGSHGCVNLPKDAAYQLYDMVSVGTTVVVH